MARARNSGDSKKFLCASRDIEYAKRRGRRLSTRLYNLLICRTDGLDTRVGIVVGKRFGLAVRRNRAKRLFRELTRRFYRQFAAGYLLLVFPKRDALGVSFETLQDSWSSILRRQGVLESHEG